MQMTNAPTRIFRFASLPLLSSALAVTMAATITLGACGSDSDDGQYRALLVVSNHGELGDTGEITGVWMAELAHPYWTLVDSGLDVAIDIASPDGGDAPIDPFSVYFNFDDFLESGDPTTGDPGNNRFLESAETSQYIATSTETITDSDGNPSEIVLHRFVDTLVLRDLDYRDYDVIYFAGGDGSMFQFPDNADIHDFIRDMYESDRLVAAACHGTSTLLNATLSDGSYLVEGKRVTGFSTAEEIFLGNEDIMPLLIQETFGERNAIYVETPTWTPNVVIDGRIITGQNPPSAEGVGHAIVEALQQQE